MKKKIIILLAIAVLTANSQVREFFIYINPDSLNLLYSRSIWDKTYIPIRFVYGGQERSGGIRFKGHTSRYYPKKPFRIRFKKGQELDGYRNLGLNAMYTDKSFMREKISFDLFRKIGAIGPETYYANLYINNKNYGLYLFVERIDDTFELNPEKYGFNRGGSMYEPDDVVRCGDLFIPSDTMNYYRCYIKKFPADSNYSDLIQLIYQLNSTPVENFHILIDSLFYGDCVLKWLLVNALTSMGDTYNKNYYLYRDSVLNKWVVIPWDYDLSLGRNGDPNLPYPLNILSDKFTYHYPPDLTGPDNPLKSKFFGNQILRQRFSGKLDSLLRYEFNEQKMYPYIDSLKALIKNYVYMDNFKWGTNEEFDEQVEALKYFVTARRLYLYKWLSNYWPGEINQATLKITGVDTVYHFVDKLGRLLASIWLYEANGLDSLKVEVYPDSIFQWLPQEVIPDKFVKRFYKITPYPQNAKFKFKLRVEYIDENLMLTEVGNGIIDERLLQLHYYDGNSWHKLNTRVNAHANTLTVDTLTDEMVNGKILSAFLPVEYNLRWQKINSWTWNKLHKVKFYDDRLGYIVGETSTIFVTTDGGLTWRNFTVWREIPFKDIDFSDSTVFMVGEQGLVYKSRVGDTIWTEVSLGTKADFKRVEFYNRSKYGVIFAPSSGFFFTADGGNVWKWFNWAGNDITMADTNILYVAEKNGMAKLRINGDSILVEHIYVDTLDFDFIRYREGRLILAGNGKIYVFNSDTHFVNDLGFKINDAEFIDTLRFFIAGGGGNIFYSKDGGKTWHKQPAGVTLDIYSIDFVDSLRGWATGIFGLMLSTDAGGITFIRPRTSSLPGKLVLYQNYPNPFNISTTIQFEIPYSDYITIEVYDVLGRKVRTLYSGYVEAGQHVLRFDAENIASGVYFYVLKSSKVLSVKKMVLIK